MDWYMHDGRKRVTRPFQSLRLTECQLTAAGVGALVPVMRRPWAVSQDAAHGVEPVLSLRGNPGLGDAGLRMVAELLPHTVAPVDPDARAPTGAYLMRPNLKRPAGVCLMDLSGTGCGDDGFAALVAALPALRGLTHLHC